MIVLRPANSDGCGFAALAPMTAEIASELGPAVAAMEPWLSYPISSASLTGYLTRIEPGAPRYVIRDGEDAVGVAAVRLNWLRGPYLQLLAILPSGQGRGLGQLVLDWMERDARAIGDRNLWVAAADYNTGAIRFYERHGFKRVAAIDGLVHDDRSDVLLRKKLSRTTSA